MQTDVNRPVTATDNLLEFEELLVRADGGKRFANYLIDVIAFYAFLFLVALTIGLLSPTLAELLFADVDPLLDRIITLLLYAIFMSAVEAIFKGKTLGKLITATRAVNLDGSRISGSKALSRGFSRAVPFCAFSALGTPCIPWQDKWTDTMVIDERKSQFATK